MDFLQLEYFVELSRINNVTRTAEKLHISQPALSQLIKKLESELSVPLFYREPGGLVLTEEGQLFLNYAIKTLTDRKEIYQKINDSKNEVSGDITVQTNAISYLIAQAYCNFKIQYPLTSIHFKSYPDLQQNTYIMDPFTRINLFITTCPPINHSKSSWLLRKEQLFVALPSNHQLADRILLSLTELAQEPFLIYQGGELQQLTELCCRKSGFTPNILFECHNTNILLNLVASGLGISIFPESWKNFASDNVLMIPLKEKYERSIYLCWSDFHYLNKASSYFKDYLINYFT